jgi:transglutaminase-like putative cysteine protease
MRYLAFAAAAVTLASAFATADTPTVPGDPNAEVPSEELRAWDTYTLEADGRYVHDADYVVLIRNERGVHERAQIAFFYAESREKLDVIDAYTETPDGRKIPVPTDKILIRESPVVAGAPMFADIKVTTIIFPDVGVHSKLHYRTRLTEKQPLFPGYFNLTDTVDPHGLDDDDRITVYAAEGATLKTDVVGYQGGAIGCPADEKSRKCYAWTARNTVFVPPEVDSVSPADYGQHVLISNFPSYEAIAKAYWGRAADKVRVTPEIQALADQLTQGISDPRGEAEALYNWVARNIRYVAISIGLGTVVPRAAETVLHDRYGDCKDHVTLLQSLLAAKHIDSVGVLVGVDRRWKLPGIPDVVFNHIITFIPSLNLYADSTSQFSRFGQLPEIYVGKLGLKTQPVAGTKQFEPITSRASEGQITTSVEMQVNADGSASGTAEAQSSGSSEMWLRGLFARLPPGQEEAIARTELAAINESGSGSFTRTDPRDLMKPFVYQTKFTITSLVSLPGPGAFPVPYGLRPQRVSDLARAAPLASRRYPWTCGIPGIRKEITRLTLPESMHIIGTPKDVHVQNDFGRYDAHYEQNGNVVRVTREFAHTFTGQPCDDGNYQQFRELTQAIERDVKAQFLFQ